MAAVRVLVTGGAGLLGRALAAVHPPDVELAVTWRRTPVRSGVTAHQVDLADAQRVTAAVAEAVPDLVVHTAYDKRDGQRDIVDASRNVARACREVGAELIHLSTDVVFAGEDAPYLEDDHPDPVNAYGRWKASAERDVRELVPSAAIVRTSLLLDPEQRDPTSAWVVGVLAAGRRPDLFVDELRQPLMVADAAAALWDLARVPVSGRQGVWHIAGPEVLSRYALGLMLARRTGHDPRAVDGVPSPRDAADPRPRDLRLSTWRADAALAHRPRPVSAALAPPVAAD